VWQLITKGYRSPTKPKELPQVKCSPRRRSSSLSRNTAESQNLRQQTSKSVQQVPRSPSRSCSLVAKPARQQQRAMASLASRH
ncbi:hypothetical protein HaLaN_00822, partial [Haematococcus lacustris]